MDEAGFEQAVEAALDVGPFDRQVGLVEDVVEFLAQDESEEGAEDMTANGLVGIVNLIDRQINPSNFLSESSCDAIEKAPNEALHVT